MKTKRKRLIALKNPRLRKIRTELRNLLKQVYNERILGYYEQLDAIRDDSSLSYDEKERKCNEIYQEIQKLDLIYIRSPIRCRLCGKTDLDLVYNPILITWHCERCYNFNQKCQDGLLPPGIYYP